MIAAFVSQITLEFLILRQTKFFLQKKFKLQALNSDIVSESQIDLQKKIENKIIRSENKFAEWSSRRRQGASPLTLSEKIPN